MCYQVGELGGEPLAGRLERHDAQEERLGGQHVLARPGGRPGGAMRIRRLHQGAGAEAANRPPRPADPTRRPGVNGAV